MKNNLLDSNVLAAFKFLISYNKARDLYITKSRFNPFRTVWFSRIENIFTSFYFHVSSSYSIQLFLKFYISQCKQKRNARKLISYVIDCFKDGFLYTNLRNKKYKSNDIYDIYLKVLYTILVEIREIRVIIFSVR